MNGSAEAGSSWAGSGSESGSGSGSGSSNIRVVEEELRDDEVELSYSPARRKRRRGARGARGPPARGPRPAPSSSSSATSSSSDGSRHRPVKRSVLTCYCLHGIHCCVTLPIGLSKGNISRKVGNFGKCLKY